jgi:hypothetical protein
MIDLNAVNRLMSGLEWLNGPAAENNYHHLTCAISQLRRDGDVFVVPEPNTPYAWREAWTIYLRLRARAQIPPAAEKIAEGARALEVSKLWNTFLIERQDLLDQARYGGLDEDAHRYLGLHPADLGPVMSSDPEDARYDGRRRDWRSVAARISLALGRWNNMSKDDKRQIPGLVARAKVAKLEKELADLRASKETAA